MGKIKDIFKGPHKYFACFVVAVTAAFLLFWLVGSGNTFINWAKAAAEIRRQEKQMEQYRREIEAMDKDINELKNNKDSLEKFAREQFHFAAPDEDVYLIKD